MMGFLLGGGDGAGGGAIAARIEILLKVKKGWID
jgi:hypothetical protein